MKTAEQNQSVQANGSAIDDLDTTAAATTPDSDDSVVITLKKPILRGKTRITEVVVRKPSVLALAGVVMSDLARMQTDEVIRVLPRTTVPSLVRNEVVQLDPADFFAMAGVLSNFFVSDQLPGLAEA
ncbi:phage tail assembly protein [Comamonas sp. B-9]|uniref:phage tail assembly protein n=1 Tax=Comamonas sp. B-9 TaxID=1055192 RepID=UPI0003955618|nr:phage tail assembly protein [Comamonas sp. B-9]